MSKQCGLLSRQLVKGRPGTAWMGQSRNIDFSPRMPWVKMVKPLTRVFLGRPFWGLKGKECSQGFRLGF